jgi:membrane-associated phospholipid phosphatase
MMAAPSTIARPSSRALGPVSPAVVVFTAGAVGIVISGLIARSGTVGAPERSVFELVNGLPGWLYPVMWPLQQAGNLAAGLLVALVALVCRRNRLALAALVVTLIDVESYVKQLVVRERPGTTVPSAILRGDVPVDGQSFPSGHAVLIASLAVIVTPYLRGWWRWVPWIVVAGVAVGRVYVGAHNPLDVIAGVSLGLMIGVVVRTLAGPPTPVQHDDTATPAPSPPSSTP